MMIMFDPDYEDIYFYIWIQYKNTDEAIDTAKEILLSFNPI